MRRPLITVICTVAVVSGACAVPAQDEANTVRDEAVPFALLDPQAPPIVPPASGPTSEPVDLCFVREGRIVVLGDELAGPVDLQVLLDALASLPSEAGPLLRTALTEPPIVRDVRLLGGIARVDLLSGVSNLPAEEQLLAIGQIVCTLTARPGVGQVSFTLEGAPLAVPKGDGSLVTSPVARDDYVDLMG